MLSELPILLTYAMSDGGSPNRAVIRMQTAVTHRNGCKQAKGCGCNHRLQLPTGMELFYFRFASSSFASFSCGSDLRRSHVQ
jgi:hypothetical protein